MNYRHAFHAGNFADVVKHAVLARILAYLKEKPAPFRVIDTHAGAGLYDLSGAEATRTGEWRDGIGRLLPGAARDTTAARDQVASTGGDPAASSVDALPPAAQNLLAPYLEAVAAFNRDGGLRVYPGSPALVQHWLRTQDRLIVCEREPTAARALANRIRGDNRIKAIEIDGYTALNAYVPPKERRGLVLIDPPFEQPDEFERLVQALIGAHRKWPTGIYMLWYPLKDIRATEGFAKSLIRSGIARILRAELNLARAPERLSGSGLIIVNPPWTLHDELAAMFPALARVLGGERQRGSESPPGGGSNSARIDWLAGEK